MNTIRKIQFLYGPIQFGYVHINENNEITLFTDENGNELTEYASWTSVDE